MIHRNQVQINLWTRKASLLGIQYVYISWQSYNVLTYYIFNFHQRSAQLDSTISTGVLHLQLSIGDQHNQIIPISSYIGCPLLSSSQFESLQTTKAGNIPLTTNYERENNKNNPTISPIEFIIMINDPICIASPQYIITYVNDTQVILLQIVED